MTSVQESDLIIWAFPVYYYSIPGQLKRFIELIFERKTNTVCKDKYATAILTSGLIFDSYAHDYIHAVSEDLGMSFYPGLSFNTVIVKDLLQPDMRKSYILYYKNFFEKVLHKKKLQCIYKPLNEVETSVSLSNPGPVNGSKKEGNKLLLLTDHLPGSHLESMVHVFLQETDCIVEVINIRDIELKSGCIGCVDCQFTWKCTILDSIREIYIKKMVESDGIIFCFTTQHRHISARWKMFFDRGIFVSKIPHFKDKYSACLVDRPAPDVTFVSDFIQVYTACRQFKHVGTVYNDSTNPHETEDYIANLAEDIQYHIKNGITLMKKGHSQSYHFFVREMLYIYSSAKPIEYKYFKKHRLFDFPHKRFAYVKQHILFNIVFNIPILKDKLRKKALSILVKPYKNLK